AMDIAQRSVGLGVRLTYTLHNQRANGGVVDVHALMRAKRAVAEDNCVVKGAECFVERKLRHRTQKVCNNPTPPSNAFIGTVTVFAEPRVAENAWNSHLRHLCRTNLDHLGVIERGAESTEVVVAVAVIIFHPPTTGSGPRELF